MHADGGRGERREEHGGIASHRERRVITDPRFLRAHRNRERQSQWQRHHLRRLGISHIVGVRAHGHNVVGDRRIQSGDCEAQRRTQEAEGKWMSISLSSRGGVNEIIRARRGRGRGRETAAMRCPPDCCRVYNLHKSFASIHSTSPLSAPKLAVRSASGTNRTGAT